MFSGKLQKRWFVATILEPKRNSEFWSYDIGRNVFMSSSFPGWICLQGAVDANDEGESALGIWHIDFRVEGSLPLGIAMRKLIAYCAF